MKALVDASSAIILCKAGLHHIISEMYNVVMSKSVYDEITTNSYPGSKEYQQLLIANKITIQEPLIVTDKTSVTPAFQSLGQGEYDVIRLYYSGQGDFIITDDGAAARYCRRGQIDFINALLIPVILGYTGKHTEVYCREAFKKVTTIGRYAPWVIDYAEKCKREKLSCFFP